MLPIQKPKPTEYMTLEEIQARKDQLLEEINNDSNKFGTKWHQLFAPKTHNTKTEFIGSLISNSLTAIDAFLLVRKLINTYGSVLGIGKKKK